MELETDFSPPKFWDFLSIRDQNIYRGIYDTLHNSKAANSLQRIEIKGFKDIIDAIDIYENIDIQDKWKRCLVCGLVKLSNMLAVNISQLKHLIHKSKSSINGSLKTCGFDNCIKKSEGCDKLLEAIPYLRENPSERRKWTLRQCFRKPKEIANIEVESDFSCDSDQFDFQKSIKKTTNQSSLLVDQNKSQLDTKMEFTEKSSNKESTDNITEPEVAQYTDEEIIQMYKEAQNSHSSYDDFINFMDIKILPSDVSFDI